MARPTKYNETETCEKALAYLAEFEIQQSERSTFMLKTAVTPSLVGLALYLGIANSTLDAWRADEEKERFSGICSTVMQIQHEILVSGGLSNAFNAQITKMMLTKHGYTDKVETDVTTKGQSLNTWTVNPVTTNKDG